MNGAERSEHSERLQQPKHDTDDNDGVQDAFDLSIHWYVIIDKPKQHTNDDQGNDNINERHRRSPDCTPFQAAPEHP
jgi:hypothetical protein